MRKRPRTASILHFWTMIVTSTALFCLLSTPSSRAEFFLGGAIGGNFPLNLSDVQFSSPGEEASSSDIKLEDSFSFGGKIGYFFSSIKWIGLELEGYTSEPNIEEQEIGIMGIPVDLSGADLRVATGAVNLALRYPGKRFEPYIGAGPAVVYAKVSNLGESVEVVVPGLNVVAGSRFFLLDWLALYGEYKFNYATFDFDNNDIQLQGTYQANHFHAGLSLHFK